MAQPSACATQVVGSQILDVSTFGGRFHHVPDGLRRDSIAPDLIHMRLLRCFLTLPSFAKPGCAKARPCICVPILGSQPLSPRSADTLAASLHTPQTANPTFSRPPTNLFPPELLFKSHSAPRPPQTPAASS